MKHPFFRKIALSATAVLLFGTAASAHQVMSWISPYGMPGAQTVIDSTGDMMATGLTRIGLQFWVPTSAGGIAYDRQYADSKFQPSDAHVAQFRDWAHSKNIATLLCIYNAQGGWNWTLASTAFKVNGGQTLADALLAEVDRLDLDGVDLDLEGNGNFGSDKAAYNSFVQKLSAGLKQRKKVLTIDTFHSTCYNAPNVSWWSDWVGLVDQIHTMGYEDLYEGSTQGMCDISNIFKYSRQNQFGTDAGLPAGTILMGLPTNASWGSGGKGSSLANHLDEVLEVGTGIAIWEIYTMGAVWKQQSTWDKVALIKGETCGFHPEDPVCTGEDPGENPGEDPGALNPLQPHPLPVTLSLRAADRNGITLQLSRPLTSGSAELLTLQGKKITSTPLAGEEVRISAPLTSGLYLVRVKSGAVHNTLSVRVE